MIGWGNWSRSTQMKGCIPTPGKGLRRLVSKKYTTYLVDEFNTSKICTWCEKELKNKSVGGRSIYRCRMCEGCLSRESKLEIRRFINRDINGAMNILKCLKGWITDKSRPRSLQRTATTGGIGGDGVVVVQKRADKKNIKLVKKKGISDRNVSIENKFGV